MNWYKHYLGDYARDTAHLSLTEHGAYRVLLDSYYATARPLPPHRPALYRICKAFSAAERKAVDVVAEQYFPVGPDGSRHNKRADEEIAKWSAQAEANRAVAAQRERLRREHEALHESLHERPQKQGTNRSTNALRNQNPEPETSKTKPPARARAGANNWWANLDSILAKAKELGLSTRGESAEALKAQIRGKLGV